MITSVPTEFETPAQGIDFLRALYDQHEMLEQQAAETNKLIAKVETETLPAVFDKFDETDLTTLRGNRAERKWVMVGSLPHVLDKDTPEEARDHQMARIAAIDLAVEYGWEPFIKCVVSAQFDKGDREKALKLYNLARGDNSAVVEIKEDIHFMTLQKQARERLQAGRATNLEALGLKRIPAVKLAKPKKDR